MTRVLKNVRRRAIRGAWIIARNLGVASKIGDPPSECLMTKNEAVRKAIVRAWEVGYAHGKRDAEKGDGKK